MKRKAVSLLSGGLDSVLATRLIMDQDIEVLALHFTSPFCNCTQKKAGNGCGMQAARSAEELGVTVTVKTKGIDYLRMVQSPPHGYGRNMNPCIDCRIFMLRTARSFMEEVDAGFVITGEVLGQRPMSQRRDTISLIERESDLAGLIVRPLSAHHFPPTIPEQEGVIDRGRLLSLSGRSRKGQYGLAQDYGLTEFGCPAGGCLLTDSLFAGRLRDLFLFNPDCTMYDAALLKTGRHFRLSPSTKLIVGRNKEENDRLRGLAQAGHLFLLPVSFTGPSGLLVGPADGDTIGISANIMASYAKNCVFPVTVASGSAGSERHVVDRLPIDLDPLRT
ncbi:MAG: hypothetical protein ABSC19_16125 [Syntrophorhabdales bacterium]|jgi:tRNA U34 2-thiouridine synthase MnmA/TrmU